jgi:flagellar hook-associated protein 2
MVPLDIPDYVSGNPRLASAFNKYVNAEQKKLAKAEEKIARQDGEIKLVQEFKGRVNSIKESMQPFKTVSDFRELKGISSQEEILKVTSIDKNIAKPGSYEFEVLSLANSDSIMTHGFPDKDKSEVGVGYVTFKTPEGAVKDIYINSDNNTLEGVASSINQAGVGVSAMVVNDGTDAENPWRLVISGKSTGWRHDYDWPKFYMVDGDLDLDIDRNRDAASAVIKINGHPIMADENKLKDLLPGVNIDLLKAQPGQSISVTIEPDFEKISGKAGTMVEKINSTLQFIHDQNNLDKDSRKDPSKALGGDVLLQTIESRMKSLIQRTQNQIPAQAVRRLSDVGIEFTRQGTLSFNGEKFQKNLETNFEEVEALFSGTGPMGGFAAEMITLVDGITRSGDGMMTLRERTMKDKVTDLEKRRDREEQNIQKKIDKMRIDFGRAESAMEEMQQIRANMGAINAGG